MGELIRDCVVGFLNDKRFDELQNIKRKEVRKNIENTLGIDMSTPRRKQIVKEACTEFYLRFTGAEDENETNSVMRNIPSVSPPPSIPLPTFDNPCLSNLI